MAYGFSGTLGDFLSFLQAGAVGPTISGERKRTGGTQLQPVECDGWDKDAPILKEALNAGLGEKDIYVLAEYDIPGHLGRCDLLLLGRDSTGKKSALIVELKRWTAIYASSDPNYVNLGGRLHIAPWLQAVQYRDKCEFFHQLGSHYRWNCAVFVTAPICDSTPKPSPVLNSPIWCIAPAPPLLSTYLKDLFSGGISIEEFLAFRDAGYSQVPELAVELIRRLPSLTRGLFKVLGRTRTIDLTQDQQEVVSTISHHAIQHDKSLLLISGPPGCGKTVVGLHAMVESLARNPRAPVVLALRNNRLCEVIRAAIDDASSDVNRKIGTVLVQYIKGGGPKVGIFHHVAELLRHSPRDLPFYDVLILDEAHRVPHRNSGASTQGLTQLEAVLRAGRTVVCLFDEGQVLNEDDAGTRQIIADEWRRLFGNAPILELTLREQHRLPTEQIAWLSRLLEGRPPGRVPLSYEFKVVSSPSELISVLRERGTNDPECQYGLLASYTYSDGRKGNTLRIPELNVHWLMQKEDYAYWWRDQKYRHQLTRCASVYGCQGFDLDYAGVFWGRDLSVSIADGAPVFDLCCPHEITDNIGQAYGQKFRTLADRALTDESVHMEVISRLKNRYRILLSRARYGTFVYCEDPATAAALQALIAGGA